MGQPAGFRWEVSCQLPSRACPTPSSGGRRAGVPPLRPQGPNPPTPGPPALQKRYCISLQGLFKH